MNPFRQGRRFFPAQPSFTDKRIANFYPDASENKSRYRASRHVPVVSFSDIDYSLLFFLEPFMIMTTKAIRHASAKAPPIRRKKGTMLA